MMVISSENKLKIMIFDLALSGHHPSFIQYLLENWPESPNQSLWVVVPEKFSTKCSYIIRSAAQRQSPEIHFVYVPESVIENINQRRNGILKSLANWKLFSHYARTLQADHGLLMYMDSYVVPLFLRLPFDASVSGIYFRPLFHYKKFFSYNPTFKDRIKEILEKVLLRGCLSNPHVKNVFSLDPYAVDDLNSISAQETAVYVPDPIKVYAEDNQKVESSKKSLGIKCGNKVFLLFGSIDQRKGIEELLEAVRLLPVSMSKQTTLLIVGSAPEEYRRKVSQLINQVVSSTQVQIIWHVDFIQDDEIQHLFSLSDIILIPYLRHVGSSGVLIRAAYAQKPVLSSDYGLLAEHVKRHSLGITVDSTNPREIAKGMELLMGAERHQVLDVDQATHFTSDHTVENFASIIASKIIAL